MEVSPSINELQRHAEVAFQKGRYEDAACAYQKCVEVNSTYLLNYWYLGLSLFLLEAEDEAQGIWMVPFLEGMLNTDVNWEGDLLQIFNEVINQQIRQGNLEKSLRLKEIITEIVPNYENTELADKIKHLAGQWLTEALSLVLERKLKEAGEKFIDVLQLDETNGYAWYNLAMIYYEAKSYDQAYRTIQKAISFDSKNSTYYYGSGLILEKLDKLDLAMEAYQKVLEIDPQKLDAYTQLGLILAKYQEYSPAEAIFRQGISYFPEHYGCYLNLANLILDQEKIKKKEPSIPRLNEAVALYKKAVEFNPNNYFIFAELAEVFSLLGDEPRRILSLADTAFLQGQYLQAIDYYNEFLDSNPGTLEVYKNLFVSYKKLRDYDRAIQIAKTGILAFSEIPDFYKLLIYLYRELGDLPKASEVIEEAEKKLPNNVYISRIKQWLLPILYDSTEEIAFYRDRFSLYLHDLVENSGIHSPETLDPEKIQLLVAAISDQTNFYLQYQCQNDVSLQKEYGEFVHRVLSLHLPQFTQSRSLAPGLPQRRVRLGYLSASMYQHTVGKLFLGWLKYADHKKFMIHSYHIGETIDNKTQQYNLSSDVFRHLDRRDLHKMADTIIQDQLDILVFLDVGMAAEMTLLAGLRLAPIQCLTFGHPITCGSPTMDYYLSADWMEPPQAQEHYSEELILLPESCLCYALPTLPDSPKSRQDFGLTDHSILYLSCQSLFKYLPQYDYIFAAIAQKVDQAKFLFVEFGDSVKITQQFKTRLHQAFSSYNLDSEKYCIFLPRLSHYEYLSVNLISDVFLDTLGWSGGNTSLEALACGLPMVTYMGEYMRGRVTGAFLRKMELDDFATTSELDYIKLAVKLGLEPQWRQEIKEKILLNQSKLFNDVKAVVHLENFYAQAVEKFITQDSVSL